MNTLDLMTVGDIATVLQKSVRTVYGYIEHEYIPPQIVLKIGNEIRIKRKDLELWVNSCRRRK